MIYLLEGLDQETKDELFNALFGHDAGSDRYYIHETKDGLYHGNKDAYNELEHQNREHGDINDLVEEHLSIEVSKVYLISNTNYYSMDKIMAERELNKVRNTYLINLNFNVMTFDNVRKKMNEVEEKYYIIEVEIKG